MPGLWQQLGKRKNHLAPFEPRIDTTPSGHSEISTSSIKSSALVRLLDMVNKVVIMNTTEMTFRGNKAFDSLSIICSKQAPRHIIILIT